jgi:effector-binding domain-containing protein
MVAPTITGPAVAEVPRRQVLYQHHVVGASLLTETLGHSFQALYGRVGQAGVIPVGAPFVIYGDESKPGVLWDMRICVPISSAVTESDGFRYMDMPAGRVVEMLHIGPYETLGEAYEAIDRYVEHNHLTPTGPAREFYLSRPDVPAHEIKTLIERPIK